MRQPQLTAEPQDQEIPDGNIQMQSGNTMDKPSLENWQKYMENGEYLRSSELDEEQNYNMIDGRRNNMPPKARMAGRPSWQSCAVNRQGLQSGAENPHSRWQWQRIWSAGGSKKGRSVWQMLSDASSFVCLEQSGVSLYNKTITGRA